jgi:hypothetical protein
MPRRYSTLAFSDSIKRPNLRQIPGAEIGDASTVTINCQSSFSV